MAAPTPPELFASLRAPMLSRLVELRGALDESLIALSEADMSERLELLLDRYAGYLSDGDAERQRRFVRRWLAIRLGEGRSPESVMHALVAANDILVQVARDELSPGPPTLELVRSLQRLSYVTARSLVAVLAEDLQRKSTPTTSAPTPSNERDQ